MNIKHENKRSFSSDKINPKANKESLKVKEKTEKVKFLISEIIDKLDNFTNARSTILLVLIFYMLGRSLNYFIYFILAMYLYLLLYRLFRFWVHNSLMLMLDFIYFGNICLIIFILFCNDNYNLFISVYSCCTGVIALTIIVDKNDVDLSDTDFITSTFLDAIPILTSFAIRWKHILYREEDSNFVLKVGKVPMKFDDNLAKIIVSPIVLWLVWAIGYITLNGKFLRKFAYSNLYESTICKFYYHKTFSSLLGDHKKFSIIKYLFIQLILLLFSIPIVINCFYNFYFSCLYILFIIVFLGFNSARNKEKRMKDLIQKAAAQEYKKKHTLNNTVLN